ncbi:MAG TPA: alpha/beta fold hydrolase [Acidimicrobiales bacterium]|nr:alpha/beta fold hydrolase [Acidimicrobiales bacterium]
MPHTDWHSELARARRFARRLGPIDALAPDPPANLPPARLLPLPGRGEMFLRDAPAATPAAASNPPIALLHGWTASADLNWLRVYDTIPTLGRMIAVDHRGHGRGIRTEQRFTLQDAADDVAATLIALDAAPAILVGYSMGGPIALLTWLRHPEVVHGLVLEATALEWRAKRSERFTWRFMAVLEFLLRLGRPRGMIERALRDMVEQSPDLEPLVPWLKGEMRRGDPEALADAGRALGEYDFRPHASKVDVPTAVVVTTKDRLVRPRKQRRLAHAIPGAKTFDLHGDHDAALVLGREFPAVTADAVRWVQRELERAQSFRRTAG